MKPVSYSAQNQAIVDAYDGLPPDQQVGSYWSNDSLTAVRKEIKDYYIAEQKYLCVYCKRQIHSANNALWDAEHIVCRDGAPQFMFHPQNLAVSCKDCNLTKGKKEVRTTLRKKFPNQSGHYTIVHPHFDEYEKHIRWVGDICAPSSDKGTRTMEVCGLTRFTAKLFGIDGVLVDSGFDKYVGELMKAKDKASAEAALAAIATYVAKIPQD